MTGSLPANIGSIEEGVGRKAFWEVHPPFCLFFDTDSTHFLIGRSLTGSTICFVFLKKRSDKRVKNVPSGELAARSEERRAG